MIISTKWPTVKNKSDNNTWPIYYTNGLENENQYIVVTGSSTNQYFCKLRGSSLANFNNNYKSNATEVIHFNDAIAQLL